MKIPNFIEESKKSFNKFMYESMTVIPPDLNAEVARYIYSEGFEKGATLVFNQFTKIFGDLQKIINRKHVENTKI